MLVVAAVAVAVAVALVVVAPDPLSLKISAFLTLRANRIARSRILQHCRSVDLPKRIGRETVELYNAPSP